MNAPASITFLPSGLLMQCGSAGLSGRGGSVEPTPPTGTDSYRRPGGTDSYQRPGGTDTYTRP